MKSYVTKFIRGLVGSFRRKPDGSLECTGLALTEALTEEPAAAAAADPAVPHLRLWEGETYCGTAFGIPAIATERTPEDIAGDEAFEVSRSVTAEKIRLRLAKPM